MSSNQQTPIARSKQMRDSTNIASSIFEKQLIEQQNAAELQQQERRLAQKSIFGKFIGDRQKKREGDKLSDDEEEVKELIYEEDQDFENDFQRHRPQQLFESFQQDYFGQTDNQPPTRTSLIEEFQIKPTMRQTEMIQDNRRNSEIYQTRSSNSGDPKSGPEMPRRVQSPQAPLRSSSSLPLESHSSNKKDEAALIDSMIQSSFENIVGLNSQKGSLEKPVSTVHHFDETLLMQTSLNYKKIKKEPLFKMKAEQNTQEQNEDSNSNQSYLSDKSYKSGNYYTEETLLSNQVEKNKIPNEATTGFAGVGSGFLDEILKPKRETEIDDVLQIINISEYSYQSYAQRKLQDSKAITMQTAKVLTQQQRQTQLFVQRVLAGPKTMRNLTQQFAKRQSEGIKSTCITVSEFSVIVGTSAGYVFVYDKDTEKFHSVYREESKDFKDNTITCIDVHPLRHEYVVTGHQRGQLVLLDLTKLPQENTQNVKCIKDHHKTPLVSVKFCDWLKERPIEQDKPAWMILSCDLEGRVVLTKISNVAFRILQAEKMIVIEPPKVPLQVAQNRQFQPVNYTIATKFHSQQFPQSEVNDSNTLIAIGNMNEVVIQIVGKENCQPVFKFSRPNAYHSENLQTQVKIQSQLPCLSWGYGRTPYFKDQPYCLLAIAWGPLIQIVCLKDLQAKHGENFYLDGFYIMASSTMYKQMLGGENQDPYISSINFIDESLILVTLSNQDIRVVYTKSFYPGKFESAALQQNFKFETIDSRCKMTSIGSPLTKEQQEIELERRTYLEYPIQSAIYGSPCSQSIHTCNGRSIILSTAGIFKLQHLTWEQSLGNLEPQILNGNSWIDMFAKTLEIYLGKVKGLRGVPDDDYLRQFMMKGQMKVKIGEILEVVIGSWKKLAQTSIENGSKTREQSQTEMTRNLQTLMRIIIELTVEIDEPDYLFTDIYQRFKDEGCGDQFAAEIKPYILNGLFSEWDAPEHVLNFHILQHHQQIFQEAYYGQNTSSPTSGLVDSKHVSPAENFEKILINLSFNTCSKMNIQEMIEFCRKYKLSTGAFYLCVSTGGDYGPIQGLNILRDFYSDALKEEAHKNQNAPKTTLKELKALINMQANNSERIQLERSSTYQGLKILWAIRILLQGNKFPKGKFEKAQWHNACHSVLQHITQGDFIDILCHIDASAFFQIISIPFNSTQIQYGFIQKGGLVTHQQLIQNMSNYCLMLPTNDEIRLKYLCFIASLGGSDLIHQDRLFFYGITLELIANYEQLIQFNNDLLQKQTHSKLCKLLSQRAQKASPELRAHILSEDQLIQLIRKSEQLTQENINEIVSALQDTPFNTLKTLMYEKQEDYCKCLQFQLAFEKDRITGQNQEHDEDANKLQDCITWIIKTHDMLERRVKDWDDGSNNKQNFLSFQREVLRSIDILTQIDTHKTVGLCDAIFKSDHEQIINKLQEHPESQYNYICKLIELKQQQIKQCVKGYNLYKQVELASQAQVWTRVLALHVKLTSKLYPNKLVDLVKQIGKDNCYPIEECLKICNAAQNLEASALLSLEIGSYQESIIMYLKVMQSNLNVRALRKELFYLSKHRKSRLSKLDSVALFESHFKQIQKICLEHPEEVLLQTDLCWQKILESISSLSLDPSFTKKAYCKKYMHEILQIFCRQLLQHVNFNHIVDSYLQTQPSIKYHEMYTVIKEVFMNVCSIRDQSAIAENLSILDCKDLEDSFLREKKSGLLFRHVLCSLCWNRVDMGSEGVVVFECVRQDFNHSFHQRCVNDWMKKEKAKEKKASGKKTEISLRCPVCFKQNWDISGQNLQKTYKIQTTNDESLLVLQQRGQEDSVRSDHTKKSASSETESSGNSSGAFHFNQPLQVQKKLESHERRMNEIQKKLKNFDKDQINCLLHIDNFRVHK